MGSAKSQLDGFMDFIREQGVVALAVGIILGLAVSKVVASLVDDIVMPVIGKIIGSTDGIAALSAGGVAYGKFIATSVDFLIIAAVVYFGVKALKLDKLDKK